jgi:hypothetical protein
MIGSNRKTVSSVRGMTRYGVKLCQRLDKVDKLRDQGYMDFGILGVVNDVRMKKGEWMPQPRVTWVVLLGKRRSSRVMTKS